MYIQPNNLTSRCYKNIFLFCPFLLSQSSSFAIFIFVIFFLSKLYQVRDTLIHLFLLSYYEKTLLNRIKMDYFKCFTIFEIIITTLLGLEVTLESGREMVGACYIYSNSQFFYFSKRRNRAQNKNRLVDENSAMVFFFFKFW